MSALATAAVSAFAQQAASSAFSGGSSGGGGPGFSSVQTITPAFDLRSGFLSDGTLQTALNRLDTPTLRRRNQRQGRVLEDLDTIRGEVRPGFGRLTDAAVDTIRDRSNVAVGNLRQQLGNRRVLGSSFAGDAEGRVRNEFAREETKARSEAIIGEIALTSQILDQESDLLQQEIQNEFSELQLAQNQTNAFIGAVGRANEIDKQLAAQSQRGAGQFVGDLFEGSDISGQLNDFFSGNFGGSGGQSLLERLVSNRVGSNG